jgi:uncharacterized protein YqgV (UPF0045/DUF77 family)
MATIAAQVSLYPLRRTHMGRPVTDAVEVFRRAGLEVQMGAMSTTLVGEAHALFSALEEAFTAACESGSTILVVTVSNACPVS